MRAVDLETLVPDPNNPKQHDVGAIVTSLRRFGLVAPIIVESGTQRIVAGHGRAEALRMIKREVERGDGEPPKGVVVTSTGRWLIKVVDVEFASDLERQMYLIADNRLTELGGWDEPALALMLGHIATEVGDAVAVTGFDLDDVTVIMRRMMVDRPPNAELVCPHCGKPIFSK